MGRNEVPSAPTTRSTIRSTSDDDLERLIKRVCTTFFNQIKDELSEKINKIESKIDQYCESLKVIDTKIESNKKEMTELQYRIENLEQKSKANSLRICGIEEVEDEDLSVVLTDLFSDKLNIQISQKDIDYVFRLKSKNRRTDAPTPIIINFVSNITRNKVFLAKKQLKNSKVSIFEDLTRVRYNLLMTAKERFGKNMAWTENGRVFAWDALTKKKITVSLRNNSEQAEAL